LERTAKRGQNRTGNLRKKSTKDKKENKGSEKKQRMGT